jgi:hypothetical protein
LSFKCKLVKKQPRKKQRNKKETTNTNKNTNKQIREIDWSLSSYINQLRVQPKKEVAMTMKQRKNKPKDRGKKK